MCAENALEFIQAVVGHDELALAGSGVLKQHLGAQFVGQFALQALNIRIHRRRRFAGRRAAELMMRRTKASVSRTDRDFLATRPATSICWRRDVKPEQRARVAHFDAALLQQFLDLVGQFHEAQQIADGGARAADRLGRRLMGQAELLDQPQQRAAPLPEDSGPRAEYSR